MINGIGESELSRISFLVTAMAAHPKDSLPTILVVLPRTQGALRAVVQALYDEAFQSPKTTLGLKEAAHRLSTGNELMKIAGRYLSGAIESVG